ncbi:RING finger protein 151-like [Littorina saxatilis]|uniref:Uncharacterized protein n=1 Tax=Littorina saxatilis TaxID=31220 RepID=A0AAN9GPA6_9CAEN
MGFDIDRFVEVVNEGLLCCICRDVLEDPLQSPCEHAFCSSCIHAWLVAECTCPEDRQPLTSSQLRPLFRYMRNDLARLRIRCRNHRLGCDHIGKLEFAPAHQEECPLEEIFCPHGCGRRVARGDMSEHMEECEGVGAGAVARSKECTNGCGLVIVTDDDREHNCIAELRTNIEILRSEMLCKLEDQRQEMELRLDMQRGHMIQRESALKGHIDELKQELARVSQKIKLLLDIELQRRQDLERMQTERVEMMEVLNNLKREQDQNKNRCQHCAARRSASPAPVGGGSGKVTTI